MLCVGWCSSLESYDLVFMDLDGVVWIGGQPIKENVGVASRLASEGRLVLLTNNSTRSRRVYSKMLRDVAGINLPPERIVTSAFSAASSLLDSEGPTDSIVIGEEGLVEEMVLAGHLVYSVRDSVRPRAVVVGLDRNITYDKLRAAATHISNGALFIATNLDHALPTGHGLVPGAGSIISLLSQASGREPDMIAGKPSKTLITLLNSLFKPKNPVVIGDRLDTDVALAEAWGVDAVLVLTGLYRGRSPPEAKQYTSINLEIVRSLEELCS
ncbi:MAG: HAD-IIA family hydrolase [Aeropyrum sp.]|nr:HAD-IIA family hydrolase [Aeropyrum sp.]